MAPFRNEDHALEAYQFDYGFDFGLPADVEDLEAFVRDPQSRVQISGGLLRGEILLSGRKERLLARCGSETVL